jgi:hypothetical protein
MEAVSNAAVVLQPVAPLGMRGGLAKLAHASHGDWLLGIPATGPIVDAFDLLQPRLYKA